MALDSLQHQVTVINTATSGLCTHPKSHCDVSDHDGHGHSHHGLAHKHRRRP